jgi:hypothetical protein
MGVQIGFRISSGTARDLQFKPRFEVSAIVRNARLAVCRFSMVYRLVYISFSPINYLLLQRINIALGAPSEFSHKK